MITVNGHDVGSGRIVLFVNALNGFHCANDVHTEITNGEQTPCSCTGLMPEGISVVLVDFHGDNASVIIKSDKGEVNVG